MQSEAAAESALLDCLKQDSAHLPSLLGLGSIALRTGRRDAARTLFDRAMQCHPEALGARVTLGNMALEDGDFLAARGHYQAALARDAGCVEAAQGMARALALLGEDAAAEPFFAAGFTGHAVTRRYRGAGPAPEVAYLAAARGGNVRLWPWLDDGRLAVTIIYADFVDPSFSLAHFDWVINAIGDADRASHALDRAERLAASTARVIVNHPARVRRTGRCDLAALCRGIEGLVAPFTRRVSRAALRAAGDLVFPLLVRAPGFHTGQHFRRVANKEALAEALAAMPGEDVFLIEALDARGADGMARKYRAIFVQGRIYPWHLAISRDWKVHYFTAAMAEEPAHRAEEHRFLTDMTSVLGAPAVAALEALGRRMGLDYAGVDFAQASDGRILVFEANAAMALHAPPPGALWDYRRPACAAVQRAVACLLAGQGRPSGQEQGVSP